MMNYTHNIMKTLHSVGYTNTYTPTLATIHPHTHKYTTTYKQVNHITFKHTQIHTHTHTHTHTKQHTHTHTHTHTRATRVFKLERKRDLRRVSTYKKLSEHTVPLFSPKRRCNTSLNSPPTHTHTPTNTTNQHTQTHTT